MKAIQPLLHAQQGISRSRVYVPDTEGGISEGAAISSLQTVPGKPGVWASFLHRAGCEARDGF